VAVCDRKMEASPRAHAMYCRCPARTLAPGSPALASHPPAVYLREDPVREAVNTWLGQLFSPLICMFATTPPRTRPMCDRAAGGTG